MQKRIKAALLALVLALSLPCQSYADSAAVTYFNNLARCMGAAVDIADSVWQDKTKAAYAAYISDNLQRFVPTPNGIYACGQQLEDLTGFDVVAQLDGELYIRNPGGGYNIDNYVKVSSANYSSLCAALLEWFDVAVNDGPTWPYEGTPGQSGGGDGSTVETYGTSIPLMKKFRGTGEFVTYNGDVTLTLTEAQRDTLNGYVSGKYSCIFYISYSTNDTTNSTSASGFVAWSNSPITIATTAYDEKNVRTTITSNSTITYKGFGIGTTSNKANWVLSSFNNNQPNASNLPHTRALYVTGGVSIPEIPGATDNTPPVSGGDTNININWPDITYTGPTYNYEGDTYNTTSGDIDWSPVTLRMDAAFEEFELFENSFESFRSDFVVLFDNLGDALQILSDQLTAINNKLNKVIDWLINIFNKMNTGPQSTQPNPDTDEGGFWEWLGRLLDKLIGNLPEGLSSFTDALSQLTGRFPFSVPWDLAAMLGLFAHEPVTPEFDYIMPTVTSEGYSFDVASGAEVVHVSLEQFDEVAELARVLEYIVFAIMLAGWSITGMKGIDWTLFD